MNREKLRLSDLEVQSFVTAQSRALRGGICTEECKLDSGCADCTGGGGGTGGTGGTGGGNPTGDSDCQCVSLQGHTCPSNPGEWFC